MPSMKSLIENLKNNYPQFAFLESDIFHWSHTDQTIYYNLNDPDAITLTFHELGHATLQHKDYCKNINLIEIECDAWTEASKIAKKYSIKINNQIIQSSLDTYRNWLHKSSLCPECESNGLQIKDGSFLCPICNNKWTTNNKDFNIRRYKK